MRFHVRVHTLVGIAILGKYASKEATDLLVRKLELYKYNGCMDYW